MWPLVGRGGGATGISADIVPVPVDAGPRLPDLLGPDDVAWFEGSSRPGDKGVALLAGHVVWNHGPAIFSGLSELRPGEEIVVTDREGRARSFTIRGSATVSKFEVPAAWYTFTPEAQVVLLTCSGPVDPNRHLRTNNFAVLASAPA